MSDTFPATSKTKIPVYAFAHRSSKRFTLPPTIPLICSVQCKQFAESVIFAQKTANASKARRQAQCKHGTATGSVPNVVEERYAFSMGTAFKSRKEGRRNHDMHWVCPDPLGIAVLHVVHKVGPLVAAYDDRSTVQPHTIHPPARRRLAQGHPRRAALKKHFGNSPNSPAPHPTQWLCGWKD